MWRCAPPAPGRSRAPGIGARPARGRSGLPSDKVHLSSGGEVGPSPESGGVCPPPGRWAVRPARRSSRPAAVSSGHSRSLAAARHANARAFKVQGFSVPLLVRGPPDQPLPQVRGLLTRRAIAPQPLPKAITVGRVSSMGVVTVQRRARGRLGFGTPLPRTCTWRASGRRYRATTGAWKAGLRYAITAHLHVEGVLSAVPWFACSALWSVVRRAKER